MLAVFTVLVFVAGAVYFFAIRDDDKAGDENTTLSPQTFNYTNVPFTFVFPGNFANVDPPPQGFLWMSGIGPYDIIDVKRLSNDERSVAEARASVKNSLQARPGLRITGEGTETFDNVRMARFAVDTDVEGQTLKSTLYYFSLGGSSWQLECQSTAANRAAMDAACVQAMSTFDAK